MYTKKLDSNSWTQTLTIEENLTPIRLKNQPLFFDFPIENSLDSNDKKYVLSNF